MGCRAELGGAALTHNPQEEIAFGAWLRQRRRAFRLTQDELARQVGCSTITLRKLEAEERRPSPVVAERLAEALQVAPDDRANFLQFARGDPFAAPVVSAPPLIAPPVASIAAPRDPSGYNLTDADNPYKGLQAFGEGDAADFFGREALTRQLLARLGETSELAHFLAVVGPSGCGKSSVARSGLIPALRRGELPGSSQWVIVQLLPGAHPLEELEAALLRVAVNPPESLLGQLREDTRGLARAVRRCLPDDPTVELMLIIDQFEEVFTLVPDEEVRVHLLDSLVAAVLDERSRVHVVITLRADFVDRPLNYLDFGDLLRQRMEAVLPLSADELERVIVGPAERLGLEWEQGLVPALIQGVAGEPGALPLLEYTLTRLFEQRDGRGLTKAAYQSIGGVLGALGQRAEEVYAQLGLGEQALARQLFLRLVALGEGAEDTRRRVPRAELDALDSGPIAQAAAADGAGPRSAPSVGTVIEAFGQGRLLSFDRDLRSGAPTVEVAHEALLREWARLRDWLSVSRADLRLQRQLAAAAEDWRQAGRDPSFLLTGARLGQFEGWAASTDLGLTAGEREYLDASLAERQAQGRAEQDRQRRNLDAARRVADSLRRRAIYLGGALALVLALAVAALYFGQQARQNATVAEQNAQLAQQNAHIAQQNAVSSQLTALLAGSQAALANGDTETAIALAKQAVKLNPSSANAQVALRQAAYAPGTVRYFHGHADGASAIAVNPDGRTALTNASDFSVTLWELATGREIRRFSGQGGAVNGVALSPDGRTALGGSDDGTLLLWDVASGGIIRRFVGHTDAVRSVAFSPDGRTALSGSSDQTLILWDVATGKAVRQFKGHSGRVESVVFSPDGKTALSGGDDHGIILWDVASGQEIRHFAGHSARVNSVAFSPDGRTALSGANEPAAILWDVASGQEIRRLDGNYFWVLSVQFSPDGRRALTGDFGGTANEWDLSTGQAVTRQLGNFVAYAPDGRHVLLSNGSTLRLSDLQSGQVIRSFEGRQGYVKTVAFSPDERTALSASDDGTAILWNVATGQEIRRFISSQAVYGAAFAPQGSAALLGYGDLGTGTTDTGGGVLWDTTTGHVIRPLVGIQNVLIAVAYSPDGQTAVSAAGGGDVVVWDVANGTEMRSFFGFDENNATAVAFSPDGRDLLTGYFDGQIALWAVNSATRIRALMGHKASINGLAFSPDGKMAFSGSEDATAILWDIATGNVLRRFTDHTGEITVSALSPDGRYAFAGSADGSSIIWDIQTGDVVERYIGPGAGATGAAYTRDGKDLLVGTHDGQVALWRIDATLDDLLAWIKANRYVPDLTCAQRQLYQITPLCDANGVVPTQAP